MGKDRDKVRAAGGPAAGAPCWLPGGGLWRRLPEGVRRAVRELLEPAYERLVRRAPGELERSAGVTLVHLMWLELCDQARLAEVIADRQSAVAIVEQPEEWIARHLHLVAAKNSTAELLLKLSIVREGLSRGAGAPQLGIPALPGTPRSTDVPPGAGRGSEPAGGALDALARPGRGSGPPGAAGDTERSSEAEGIPSSESPDVPPKEGSSPAEPGPGEP